MCLLLVYFYNTVNISVSNSSKTWNEPNMGNTVRILRKLDKIIIVPHVDPRRAVVT